MLATYKKYSNYQNHSFIKVSKHVTNLDEAKLSDLKALLKKNLSYLRQGVNSLSLIKLRNKTGISADTLLRIESADQLPTIYTLCRLAAFYKVEVHELIGVDLKHRAELAEKKRLRKLEKDQALFDRLNRNK